MGLDESLFGFFYRVFQKARNARSDPAASSSAVLLSDLSPRLMVLASAISERRVTVLEAEDFGAVRSPCLYLPRVMDFGGDVRMGVDAYVIRTLLDATLLALDVAPPRTSALGEQLATLLVLPKVLEQVEAQFPAAQGTITALFAIALQARPRLSDVALPLRGMELLLRQRLAGPKADSALDVDSQTSAWLVRALAKAPTDDVGLREALSELLPAGDSLRLAPPVLFGALGARMREGVLSALDATFDKKPPDARSEKQLRGKERIEQVALSEEPLEENPIVHSFEKLHTADNYRGGQKRADADDELDEHAEALDELDLREVTRSGDRARSVYRPDYMIELGATEGEGEEAAKGAIPYDEWDARRKAYRRQWCSVFVDALPQRLTEVEAAQQARDITLRRHKEIEGVRAELAKLRAERAWHNRQPEGTDVDIEALVDRYASLRGGATPPDRLYIARRKRAPELSVLVLLDGSSSTESWVLGQRVLDVARDSLVVLGEALDDHDITLGVSAFSSHTRRHCRFRWIKRFDEPWSKGRLRLMSLAPEGYTRIGPALRHASHELGQRPERRKLLLLLSDGKATDYDAYEGRHGMGDVRKAISEAEACGVGVFVLAIDRTTRAHLPAMFGNGRFQVLGRPELLLRALSGKCISLLRG